jgi:hypothetical protein
MDRSDTAVPFRQLLRVAIGGGRHVRNRPPETCGEWRRAQNPAPALQAISSGLTGTTSNRDLGVGPVKPKTTDVTAHESCLGSGWSETVATEMHLFLLFGSADTSGNLDFVEGSRDELVSLDSGQDRRVAMAKAPPPERRVLLRSICSPVLS